MFMKKLLIIGEPAVSDEPGVEIIYNILTALQNEYGEDLCRPHPALKEMVSLNF